MKLAIKHEKLLIGFVAALLIVSAMSVPFALAAVEDDQVQGANCEGVRVLGAKGVAKDRSSPEEFVPAGFLLDLVAAEVKPRIIDFDVIGGTVKVDGVEYTIFEGQGGVVRYRRGFLLEASGVDSHGEEVALKIAGRYFWMWGRIYVARLVGVLETVDATYTVFLRAAIRV